MNPMYAIEPADSFGPIFSVTWVFLVTWLLGCLFAFVVQRYLTFRGRTLRAESIAKAADKKLPHAGPALLNGKVETDDGGPAVRVEIDQTGKETKNKNSWSHTWEEQNRSVHSRPFRLRLPWGEAVEVQPDERVRLVDALETERFEGSYRRRVAQLAHGEDVWVSGTLSIEGAQGPSTAYRAGPGGAVLRGTRMEPLEIASGGLDKQFSYWQRFYRGMVWLLAVATMVVHGLLFLHFHVLLVTGKVETLPIVKTSTYITKNKNSTTTHYVVHSQLPAKDGARPIKDNVSYSVYRAATDGQINKAEFIYSPQIPFFNSVGDSPDLPIVSGVVGGIVLVLAWVIVFALRASSRPWYEQRQVKESGSGRLEEKAWDAQIPGKPGLYEARVAPPTAKKGEDEIFANIRIKS